MFVDIAAVVFYSTSVRIPKLQGVAYFVYVNKRHASAGTLLAARTLSMSFSAPLSAFLFSAFFLLAHFSLLAHLCAKR